ncbi:type IV toxin-antitoxin system AbiEi family antitoxin domain-containing protein [Nocardioides marmorisolisilvae]|uniref:AbiEi antitoxin N-terminal domain-containing protein n=1 Tax=Nocardioides marmorisolisilvae TaxID=1542737 RepID=A0A3N0DWH9_9ACTN|nr:type IV toxin-antitoxin system AbiEi family antitoxin domain-containing protein [Nocardioides marmorisolisilvae]RNL79955.1 hypothetical protein EFL95_13595 [Nocardioides marmorisolisilvae]
MLELTGLHEHGVFLRRDAVGLGYDDRDLRRSIRDGEIVRIRHGAYAAAQVWADLDEVGRHVLRAHAVMLTHESAVALSHISGAALHGMKLWDADLRRVHVTRLGAMGSRKHSDVAYHDDPRLPGVLELAGAKTLSAARCALGAATTTSVEGGMVLLDSAYHLGLLSQDALRAELEGMRRWPGTARLQITLRLASPGAESVGESRARFLFFFHGLPRPELQYPVYDGDVLIATTDFAWPELGVVGEFDGKIKYGRLLKPGETPGDAVFREKRREDRIREVTGWRVVRLVWADLADPRRTAARLVKVLGRRTT